MMRILSTMKTDVAVQFRNQLYYIGIGLSVIVAIAVGWLGTAQYLPVIVAAVMVLIMGGSTFLYVVGMITFERDEGTLRALTVSPLRSSEYIWSKVITLTALATLEAVIIIGGAMAIMYFLGQDLLWPNIPWLLACILIIGAIFTLMGIVLVVRYQSFTEFAVPLAVIITVLQLPTLYFMGLSDHWLWLIIPTCAPTMLMMGAYSSLETWQWWYGGVYTAVLLIGLMAWANAAYKQYIIQTPE